MGINGILGLLPGGDEYLRSFRTLDFDRHRVALDAGGLLWACVNRNNDESSQGNHLPALQDFAKILKELHHVLHWRLCIVFDGRRRNLKDHEYARRQTRAAQDESPGGGPVVVTSTFINMAIKYCQDSFYPFIVSPFEADMQAATDHLPGLEDLFDFDLVVVTGDSDLLAYGCCKVVIVKSWFAEIFRLIDLSMKDTDDDIETKPLLQFYRLHGVLVFQLYAACMGCDVTEDKSGLPEFGKASFFKVMNDFFGEDGSDLDVESFAAKVELSGKVQKGMTLQDITSYLLRTVHSFNKNAYYYDAKGNICSMEDGEIGTPATPETVAHMKGRCDARSSKSFCESDKLALASLKAHELLHNATMDPTLLVGVNLPPGKASVDDCTMAELRAMISVRGGNTTSEAGKDYVKADLVRIVKRFLHLEANRPPLQRFHDRNKHTNGFSLKLKISEKVPAKTAFKQLVANETFERKYPALYNMIQIGQL